jgi:hypothetical protein
LALDFAFSMGTYDRLPIFALTNKEKSGVNERASIFSSKHPSFLKYMAGGSSSQIKLNESGIDIE